MIEFKGEVLVVSLDVVKVFDWVWYKVFFLKFFFYGFFEKLCEWVFCFFIDRSIKVVVDGECFDFLFVNVGVF